MTLDENWRLTERDRRELERINKLMEPPEPVDNEDLYGISRRAFIVLRICMRCDGVIVLANGYLVECGPSTENAYHLRCRPELNKQPHIFDQERAWHREKEAHSCNAETS